MFSNRYIFVYSFIMVVVVAVLLTLVAVGLKPFQENNIRIEKMKNILGAANIEATNQNAETLYKKHIISSYTINNKGEKIEGIDAFTVDMALEIKKESDKRNLPVYVCKLDNGEENFVVPVRGKGLWGPIWGYISFKSDLNTVAGTIFDHKGETPGLGAEIATRRFQKEFIGKKIEDSNGTFTSIKVIKGGAKPDDINGVDAISGGTITSNGVTEMLYNCLSDYQPYLSS